jgi:hypothetical protein
MSVVSRVYLRKFHLEEVVILPGSSAGLKRFFGYVERKDIKGKVVLVYW